MGKRAHIESFHDKLRDKCLNRWLFCTVADAHVIVESWCLEHNEWGPHHPLCYQTPREFARRGKFGLLLTCRLLPSRLAKTNRNGFYQTKQPVK